MCITNDGLLKPRCLRSLKYLNDGNVLEVLVLGQQFNSDLAHC